MSAELLALTAEMTVAPTSPAAVGTAVRDRLDGWDRHIRVDLDVEGCRLQLATLDPQSMYVEYIAVPRALRRGGYGTAILAALTGWADRNGIRLELGVSADYGMRRAVLERLYRRHGFKQINRGGDMIRTLVSREV